jgi:hypothetical protein
LVSLASQLIFPLSGNRQVGELIDNFSAHSGIMKFERAGNVMISSFDIRTAGEWSQ